MTDEQRRKHNERCRLYRERNRERVNAYSAKWMRERRAADPEFLARDYEYSRANRRKYPNSNRKPKVNTSSFDEIKKLAEEIRGE